MSDQFIRFLGKALVPVAVFATLALARKHMSASALKNPEQKYSRMDLDARFHATQWPFGIVTVLIGLLFAFGTYAALVWVNRLLATADGPFVYLLLPQNAIWWFLPGFGALVLSWELTLQLWSRLGNHEEANLYNYWSSLSAGFDCRRILRWMAVLMVLPIGVLTFLELPVHTVLRENDIRECGYAFSQCKTYRYADAARMTRIEGFRNRDGTLTKRAGIVVDFSDGRRWFSADISDFVATVDPTLTNLLAEKTHLPLEHAQTEDDIAWTNSKSGRQGQ